MKQPLIDLKAQYQTIKLEIDNAIQKVLDRTDFILGEDVKLFEEEFADYIGTEYAIGVASGTDALIIALECLGVGPGDEVITTPTTFYATTEAILRVGAEPVFVDIDDTANMDILKVADSITPRTKAILPVHMLGNPCNVDYLTGFGIPIIEDCAQSCGSTILGKQTGSLGSVGCFSFFPGKNLGAYGDGGMITTNSESVYNQARSLRKHGVKERYIHYDVGYNSRLDTLQAAILRVKLRYLDSWNNGRICVARLYIQNIINKCLISDSIQGAEFIVQKNGTRNVFNYFCFYASNRDELIVKLESQEIAAGIYFPVPMHLLPVFRGKYQAGTFPNAERHAKRVIALPMYAELSLEQINKITEAL